MTASSLVQVAAGHWDDQGLYIAVSDSVRDFAVRTGLSGSRVRVRPNLVWPVKAVDVDKPARSGFSYVGRAGQEKGVEVLTSAYHTLTCKNELSILGAGHSPSNRGVGVKVLGSIAHEEVLDHLAGTRLLVVPSLWPEPFGRVVIEALSVGTPVAVSRVGGLAGLVGDAVYGFQPGDSTELSAILAQFDSMPKAEHDRICAMARRRFQDDFSSSAWLAATNQIFLEATS